MNPLTQYGRRWSVVKVRVSVDTLVPFREEEVRAGDSSILSQNTSSAPDKTDTDSGVVKSQRPVRIVQMKDLKEVIEVETGYGDSNLWLEWIQYTARSVAKEECYACATAKPQLTTIPFPFEGIDTPRGIACMVVFVHKCR